MGFGAPGSNIRHQHVREINLQGRVTKNILTARREEAGQWRGSASGCRQKTGINLSDAADQGGGELHAVSLRVLGACQADPGLGSDACRLGASDCRFKFPAVRKVLSTSMSSGKRM